MDTDAGTWPVCRGAQHLTQADVEDLLTWVASHPVSDDNRELLTGVTATLCQAMDRRDSEPAISRHHLARVAAEWSLLRRIAHGIAGSRPDDGHVIWASPFVYFGDTP
ncbi:hypothetical protein [Streptomyces odonnellii]|uniref:hypothetical protein n=1 Tax=Streptomyces odonnellii TaxID=1417980 RepID=UPI000626968F|nr:hypothetical protein [Streptomyces odonnellii]